MMKEIALVMLLLALCIPAFAVDIPNMVGNWTVTGHGIDYLRNNHYQATGKPVYFDSNYTLAITEQNGTRFAGKLIRNANPHSIQVALGVIGSDNKTITMVDEEGSWWGLMSSSTEMELFSPTVIENEITIREANFVRK